MIYHVYILNASLIQEGLIISRFCIVKLIYTIPTFSKLNGSTMWTISLYIHKYFTSPLCPFKKKISSIAMHKFLMFNEFIYFLYLLLYRKNVFLFTLSLIYPTNIFIDSILYMVQKIYLYLQAIKYFFYERKLTTCTKGRCVTIMFFLEKFLLRKHLIPLAGYTL